MHQVNRDNVPPPIELPSARFLPRLIDRHLRVKPVGDLACTAVPALIPTPLLNGEADPRTSYPGDQGPRFELDQGAADVVLAPVRSVS
jgi:hypothetical protein